MYYESLDSAIAVHLRKTGKTQAQLADEMGMSENTFSWKRRGVREFSLSEAIQLTKIIGIDSIDKTAVEDYSRTNSMASGVA